MALDRDEVRAGFHSYADDTPRDALTSAEPPVAAGWAEVPPWRRIDAGDEAQARPSWPKLAAVAGAAMGVLAAAVLGWSAMRTPQGAAPAKPAAVAARTASPLQVVVTEPPPPPPIPKARERLEVLPKGTARGPPALAPPPPAPLTYVPLAQAVIPVRPGPAPVLAARSSEPLSRPPPSVTEAAGDASATSDPAPRRYNDCADAPTRAMALVCRDPGLADADRRMKRAYRAALAAGVPEHALARDQDDWLEVREDAARVSRRAVADIYRQRTRELQAMADEARD